MASPCGMPRSSNSSVTRILPLDRCCFRREHARRCRTGVGDQQLSTNDAFRPPYACDTSACGSAQGFIRTPIWDWEADQSLEMVQRSLAEIAGEGGFEPPNAWSKATCLTT